MYTPSAPGPARRGGNPPVSVQQAQQMRGPAPAAMQQQMGGAGGAAAVASSRVGDMLDQIKAEYEAAIQQLNMSKMEQLELERKIQSQVVEMDQIQQTLKALEANHRRLRQQYEDDVMRMRRQLEGQQVVAQQQPPPVSQQMPPPSSAAAASKLQPKRARGGNGGPPNQQPPPASMGQDDSLMSNLVAAATSSRAPRANSPVRVVPVQPASRSLQQLGQQPPPLPPPPSSQGMGGSLPPPPVSQSMDGPNATTPTNNSSRRNTIPALNRGGDDPMNGKMDPRALPSMSAATSASASGSGNGGSSPQPALKKAKLNGEGIAGLSNGKGSSGPLPSVGGPSSGNGPLLPKLHRESADSSPNHAASSSSAPAASQGMSSASTTPTTASSGSMKGEKRESSEADGSSGTTSVSASGSITSNATQKTSNSKASRLNWSCVYSSKSSMSYQESERPAAEMHQSMDHQSVVCCVRFSSDGTMMASGCHKTAQVFDVKTGDRKFSVSRPGSSNGANANGANAAAASEADDAYVRAVCFSPDCTKIVAGMPQNTIRTWDIATNEEGPVMTGHESEIYSLDYVNDLIVSGSGDRKVRLWDARTGQCKKIFGSESGGPSDGVTSVALSPDGRLLAAASLDKVVRIWDTESSQLLDRLEGHSDSVYSIAFSPDGKNVISGSLDRNIMLWDVCAQGRTTTRPRMLFQGHKDFVLSVAYTPDGRCVGLPLYVCWRWIDGTDLVMI